uniref:Uncharacterized protein n=1 Tax=Anguilla anguilla TaxID=7936 RepID=A0A0E9QFE3_ANGAN
MDLGRELGHCFVLLKHGVVVHPAASVEGVILPGLASSQKLSWTGFLREG